MKVLFSPSEAKRFGGVVCDECCCEREILFGEHGFRAQILQKYREFLLNSNFSELSKLFGVKAESECEAWRDDFLRGGEKKAILRYAGTAYEALGFESLEGGAKEWIEQNCLIFSNLYGVVRAGDRVANYKVKQGERFCELDVEAYYRANFSPLLDEWLAGEDVIDLRAGFYTKIYRVKGECIVPVFLKNGKNMSHFAKYYRGVVLRELATCGCESFDDFLGLKFGNFKFVKSECVKNERRIFFEV